MNISSWLRQAAIERVHLKFPKAGVHLVGMSSGNGLTGTFAALHGHRHPYIHSYLLLLGGADYNVAFKPRCADWRTRVLYDWVLLPSAKARMLKLNEQVLRQHSNKGDTHVVYTTDHLVELKFQVMKQRSPRQVCTSSTTHA